MTSSHLAERDDYNTPEFVAWMLVVECPLREGTDIERPAATERQLHVLRSAADAVASGRCFDGVCVDAGWQHGFRLADVLNAYGGEALIRPQCETCPANVLAGRSHGAWAGCFGWLMSHAGGIDLRTVEPSWNTGTTPGWYGLWLEAPTPQTLARQRQLWADVVAAQPCASTLLSEFLQALELALQHNLPLTWELVPAGVSDGHTWTIPPHCPRCKASYTSGPCCRTCGYQGRPANVRKRKARGQRPYLPLESFLGATKTAAFREKHRPLA